MYSSYRLRIVGALLLVTALTACSLVSVLYNSANSLIYYWADRYVDLTPAQTELFKDKLAALLHWHRKTELPRYASFLDRTAALMPSDINATEFCSRLDEAQALWKTSLTHLTPEVAEIAVMAQPAQITRLKKELEKDNRDWTKKYLAPQAKRKRELLEQTIERYETFYGSIGKEQEAFIGKLLETSPWDPERWMLERKRRHQALLEVMQSMRGLSTAAAQKKLADYVAEFDRHPDANEERWIESLRTYACEFNAQVYSQMNTQQRNHAKKKLQDYAADFRDMALAR